MDWDADPEHATGFCFNDPTASTLLDAMRRSLIHYLQEPERFARIQQNAMNTCFDWAGSVPLYEQMYRTHWPGPDSRLLKFCALDAAFTGQQRKVPLAVDAPKTYRIPHRSDAKVAELVDALASGC